MRPPRAQDLTGREFDRLTVLRRDGSDGSREAVWLCRCVCGNEVRRRSSHLRKPAAHKSCGCLPSVPPHDVAGEAFGSWTALRPLGRAGKKTRWLCRCVCGTERSVALHSLYARPDGSCGCGGEPERECVQCGKKFRPPPARGRRPSTCSRECMLARKRQG